MFDHQNYMQEAARIVREEQPYMDTTGWNVKIERLVSPPKSCDVVYPAAVVHRLSDEENGGQHVCFVDVVDLGGNRLREEGIRISNVNGYSNVIYPDKPDAEAGTNFVLNKDDRWTVSHQRVSCSDVVTDINSWLPEVMKSSGLYHYSFYIVFVKAEEHNPVDPPIDPPPADDSVRVHTKTSIFINDELVSELEMEETYP